MERDMIQGGESKLCDLTTRIGERLVSPEHRARLKGERLADQARQDELQEIRIQDFWRLRGTRYARCTLENFEVTCHEQTAVVVAVAQYRDNLEASIDRGVGLVLTGPSGTGKDHLLATLCGPVLAIPRTLKWTSGAELFGKFRDNIDSRDSEGGLLADYTLPAVLVLSDPMPIIGSLTAYQAGILYRILDYRSSHLQATWATLNVSNREEAERHLGPQIVRRLVDDSVSLACNWQPYRRKSAARGRGVNDAPEKG